MFELLLELFLSTPYGPDFISRNSKYMYNAVLVTWARNEGLLSKEEAEAATELPGYYGKITIP